MPIYIPIAASLCIDASSYAFSNNCDGELITNFPVSTSREHEDISVRGTWEGSTPYSLHPPTPSATPVTKYAIGQHLYETCHHFPISHKNVSDEKFTFEFHLHGV